MFISRAKWLTVPRFSSLPSEMRFSAQNSVNIFKKIMMQNHSMNKTLSICKTSYMFRLYTAIIRLDIEQ